MLKSLRRKGSKKHHHHSHHEEFDRIAAMSPQQRHAEYLQQAETGWNNAWEIYHSDGWKLSAGKDLETGCVYTKHYTDGHKIFKLDGLVDATPQEVFDQLVHGDNESPAWNPTVLLCKTLEKLNDNTDIAYNISSPGAGGLVSSRDFVNLRHWKTRDELTLSLGLSTCHPDMPPNHKYVRAENKPAAWVFKPMDNGNQCHFTLILKTDLKGWVPHYLVDQAMTGCLVNYIKYLRDRMDSLKQPADTQNGIRSRKHSGHRERTHSGSSRNSERIQRNHSNSSKHSTKRDRTFSNSSSNSAKNKHSNGLIQRRRTLSNGSTCSDGSFQSCGDNDIKVRLEELDLEDTSFVSR